MSKLEKIQKSYTFKPLVLKFSHINLKIAKLRSSYAFNNNCSELVRSLESASNANNKTIPTSECLEKLKEIYDDLRHKNQKLGSYENVREILQMCGVSVTEKPDEKVRENVHLMYLLKCIHCKNSFFTISN